MCNGALEIGQTVLRSSLPIFGFEYGPESNERCVEQYQHPQGVVRARVIHSQRLYLVQEECM
jgi:hypothetical protein